MNGVETRKLASGWQATIPADDGTWMGFWGRTEAEAERKALEWEDG